MLHWVNSCIWVPFKRPQWFSHYSLLSCKKQSWFSWHNPPIHCSELTQWRECSVHQELTTPFVTPISLDAHTTCGTRMYVCVCVWGYFIYSLVTLITRMYSITARCSLSPLALPLCHFRLSNWTDDACDSTVDLQLKLPLPLPSIPPLCAPKWNCM